MPLREVRFLPRRFSRSPHSIHFCGYSCNEFYAQRKKMLKNTKSHSCDYGSHCTAFHENNYSLMTLLKISLYTVSPKSFNKCRKYGSSTFTTSREVGMSMSRFSRNSHFLHKVLLKPPAPNFVKIRPTV